MKLLTLSVGQKVFSLQCEESDFGVIQQLARQLNIAVNKNSIRYRGLSADNLLLVTTLEILAQNNQLLQLQKPSCDLPSDSKPDNSNASFGKEEDSAQPLLFDDALSKEVPNVSESSLRSLESLVSSIANKIVAIESELDALPKIHNLD